MTKFNRRWYVINVIENLPTWDAKNDRPEVFFSEKAARKRACRAAQNDPHVGYDICVSAYRVFVETKPVRIEKV